MAKSPSDITDLEERFPPSHEKPKRLPARVLLLGFALLVLGGVDGTFGVPLGYVLPDDLLWPARGVLILAGGLCVLMSARKRTS